MFPPVHVRDVMTSLLQQLVKRGKLRQAAILSRATGDVVVSEPVWSLGDVDRSGLVKAVVVVTEQPMFKLTVNQQVGVLLITGLSLCDLKWAKLVQNLTNFGLYDIS